MGTSDGKVLGSVKIADAGPPSQRWNVVIVSEGYRSDEMAQFAIDAKQFADLLLTTKPFDRLRAAINVYRVDVTSKDSGAKDPTKCGGTGAKPKTYFDASFCTNKSVGCWLPRTAGCLRSSTNRCRSGTWLCWQSTVQSMAVRVDR